MSGTVSEPTLLIGRFISGGDLLRPAALKCVARHRLCQLALSHDGHPDVEALEVGPLLVTVGADDGVDRWIGSSRDGMAAQCFRVDTSWSELEIRRQNRATLSRISSAVLIQTKGWGAAFVAAT